MNPIWYDFKRTFIRLSVVILLIVSVLIAVGLGYLVKSSLSSTNNLGNINVVATTSGDKIIGYVFDNSGKPISGASVVVFSEAEVAQANNGLGFRPVNETSQTTTNSSGMFITSVVPNGTITCNVTYGGKTVTLISFLISSVTTTDYALSSGTVTYSSYSSYSGETRSRGGLVVGTSETMYSTPSSIVASYAVTGNKELIVASNVYGSNLKLYVGFMNSMPSNVTLNISSLPNYVKLTYVGTVNSYINTYDIGNLNANGSYIVVEILNSSSTNTGNTGSSSGSFGFSRFYPYGYVTDYVITTTYAQLLPFSFIFPIMMLYLSYAIFAKPRDSGALKFLLARPVTRRDVFINRYISGVLTALIIAIVFSLVSLVTIELIIGARIPLIPILPISLSLFVGLVAFFSLTYLFPTFIKSSGGYLGISIFLFLLFTIGYSIIGAILGLYTNLGIVKAQYVLGYFNPLGIFQFGEYYVDKLIGAGLVSDASGVVILPLVVLSSVLWIAVPLILGYMRFRKVEI